MEFIKKFSVTAEGMLETQTVQKKDFFPLKKKFWLVSSDIFEYDKPKRTFYQALICTLTIIVEILSSFL